MKVFVSHSLQDKSFCLLLVNELKKRGLKTWFSSEDLKVGTPLSQQIDKGIRESDYAIIVASPHYFNSSYTRKELDTLHAEEGNGHIKVLIPIWHYIDPKTDLVDSPMLSNKWGPHSYEGVRIICDKIEHRINGKTIVQKSSLRHLWAIIFLLLFIATTAFQILQDNCLEGYQYIIERFLCAIFLSISFTLFIRKKKKKYYPSARVYGLLFFIAFYMLDPMRFFVNKYCHNYYLKGNFTELSMIILNGVQMPDRSYVEEKIEQHIELVDQYVLAIQQEKKLNTHTNNSFDFLGIDQTKKLTHSFVHLPEKKTSHEQVFIKNEFSDLLKKIEKEHWKFLKKRETTEQDYLLMAYKNQQVTQYYIEESYALADKSIVVKIRFSNPMRFLLIGETDSKTTNTYMYGLNEFEQFRMEYHQESWVFTPYTP